MSIAFSKNADRGDGNLSRRNFIKKLGQSATAIAGISAVPTAAFAEALKFSSHKNLQVFSAKHIPALNRIFDYFSPEDFPLGQQILRGDPQYDNIRVLDTYFHASGAQASEEILSFLSLMKNLPILSGFAAKGFGNLNPQQLKDFFLFLQFNEESVFPLAFKAAKSLALLSIYSNESVAWPDIGYTGTHVKKDDQGKIIDFPPPSFQSPFDLEMAENLRVLGENTLTLESIENLSSSAGELIENSSRQVVIHTDILVVGTGAGASIAAMNMCEKTDQRVLALERGELVLPNEFDQREMTSRSRFLDFELSKNTLFTNGNAVVRGRLVGGSATINQALCAPTPKKILKDWQGDYGIPVDNSEYQESMDRIGTMLSISKEGFPDMGSGKVLSEGAKRLGYVAEESTRNTKNCISAGFCDLGCRNNRKLTPLNVILPRAVKSGLQILAQCEVTKVMYKQTAFDHESVGRDKLGKIKGIKGCFLDKNKRQVRKIKIFAKKVILGGGAFGSTRILLNSNLHHLRKRHQRKGAVGRHFSNHATYSMAGVFDTPIFQNIGAPLTRTLKVYENPNDKENSHVRFALEASNRHPVNHSLLLPYESPEKHYELMKAYNNTATFTILIKDSAYGGRKRSNVKIGKKSFQYNMEKKDFGNFLEALKLSAKIMFAHGAQKVLLNHVKPVVLTPEDDLDKIFTPESLPLSSFDLGSAHLMGGCRMGNQPAIDVVDPNGESWDIKDLYVMDSGVFPTSLGVNPSYTVYGFSDFLSRRLARRMNEKPH